MSNLLPDAFVSMAQTGPEIFERIKDFARINPAFFALYLKSLKFVWGEDEDKQAKGFVELIEWISTFSTEWESQKATLSNLFQNFCPSDELGQKIWNHLEGDFVKTIF